MTPSYVVMCCINDLSIPVAVSASPELAEKARAKMTDEAMDPIKELLRKQGPWLLSLERDMRVSYVVVEAWDLDSLPPAEALDRIVRRAMKLG